MKTLLLIDANSLIHRAFHALPPLTSKDGEPAQALYGLSSILLKIWREDPPEYAAAAFDRPEPTFRKERYAEYKAQRPAAPDHLVSQIIAAHDLFAAFGIPAFEQAGFEADDIIATLAKKFGGKGGVMAVILTGDMDTLQLVRDETIVVRALRTGVSDTITFNEAAVMERYGVKPEQMIDYKAMVGDPSDNVKGVSGIGPKTAAELLRTYGTLENLYKNLNKCPEKLKEKLSSQEEQAALSKELVTLHTEAPLEAREIAELAVAPDQDRLIRYFETMGFAKIIERIRRGNGEAREGGQKEEGGGRAAKSSRPEKSRENPAQGSMF